MTASLFDDFERLVREHQRVVYQVAYGVLGNAADAEDVTQDAFVRAYANLTTLRDPERFREWTCQIVRRLALNRLRADARARKREELAVKDTVTVVDVETVASEREYRTRVRRLIDGLPEKLREVLLLCAVEGLDSAAVSKLLGIPQGTVRSRLHLARKQLLEALST